MNEIIKISSEERQLISHFGSVDSFNWLMERQAEIYQVPLDKVERYPDVRGALVKATQMSWTYGVMPGKHIYLIPFNKKDGNEWRETYAVADSYEWRKASADDKAQENGWRFMTQSEVMSDADVREYVTRNNLLGPYAPTDCGVRARVLLGHEIEICKSMGIEYNPPWHYGFWRTNAQEKTDYKTKKKYWAPDNIPSGRTPEWVALKRAEKSALAQHFELRPLGGWSQKTERQRSAMIKDHLTSRTPDEHRHDGISEFIHRPPVDDMFGWNDDDVEDGVLIEEDNTHDSTTPAAADQSAIIAQWMAAENKAQVAQQWAVDVGAQPNEHAARNSMKKIVGEKFDGRLTDKNIEEVLKEYYFHQQEKLAAALDTISVDDAEPLES